jgi:hypothetical protein
MAAVGATFEATAQPTTYARVRWHAACAVSCGGIGQESAIETVSPQPKTNKSGVTMGGSRCSRVLLLTALVPLAVACPDSAVALHTSAAQLQAATGNDLIERINSEATKVQMLKATVTITASVSGSNAISDDPRLNYGAQAFVAPNNKGVGGVSILASVARIPGLKSEGHPSICCRRSELGHCSPNLAHRVPLGDDLKTSIDGEQSKPALIPANPPLCPHLGTARYRARQTLP